jgi:hypothetical protein
MSTQSKKPGSISDEKIKGDNDNAFRDCVVEWLESKAVFDLSIIKISIPSFRFDTYWLKTQRSLLASVNEDWTAFNSTTPENESTLDWCT